MDAQELILTRKSVRSFKDTPIEDEKIELLMKAAMAAPSAVNRQPWEFYVVKSEEMKKEVNKVIPFGKYKSPIIVIPCIKESASIPLAHDLVNCDLGAASENILLMAHALGLGAVWCAVYPNKLTTKGLKKAINIPAGLTPFSAIYVGYPSDDDKSKVKDKYDTKKVRTI